MYQDRDRHEVPPNKCWNMVDYLPGWGGADLVGRGGWKYYSGTLGSTANYIWKTDFVPYEGSPHQVTFDSTGVMWFDGVSKGSLFKPFQTAFLKNQLFVLDSARSATPRLITSTGTTSNVTAAPKARYACTWGEYMLAAAITSSTASGTAATAVQGERTIFFSAPNDPTTWSVSSVSGAWFNMSNQIRGLAVANGVILAFSDQGVERLVGTNPPPGGNLARRWLADHGCIDWRSIENWGMYALWCDIDGVYMTDGAAVTDLTAQAGVKQYFINSLSGFTSNWTVAAGVYQDKYIVSIMNGSTFVDCMVFDLLTRSMFRFSNMPACGFSHSLAGAAGASDEIYMAMRNTPRIGAGSSMWFPSAAVKNDGDGTPVLAVFESALLQFFYKIPGMRRIFYTNLGMQERVRKLYMEYDLRDAASDNPTLTLGYLSDPALSSYTALSPVFPETTGYKRTRVLMNKLNRSFGLRITQQNPSAVTKIYGLGFEGHVQEGSR